MKKRLECPACGFEMDVGLLSETGLDMLAKHGPPLCPECSAAKMRRTFTAFDDGKGDS